MSEQVDHIDKEIVVGVGGLGNQGIQILYLPVGVGHLSRLMVKIFKKLKGGSQPHTLPFGLIVAVAASWASSKIPSSAKDNHTPGHRPLQHLGVSLIDFL